MAYFLVQWAVLILGFLVHAVLDRTALRRTGPRLIELALLWVVVGNGAFLLVGGLSHIGPSSNAIAESIGYPPSMFQWEVGWADLALGALAVACAWRANRGPWLTATVVATAIALAGDGIGHVMQLAAHDNTAPNNMLAIPSDFLIPVLAIVLLVLYRRGETARDATTGTAPPAQATSSPVEPRRAP